MHWLKILLTEKFRHDDWIYPHADATMYAKCVNKSFRIHAE